MLISVILGHPNPSSFNHAIAKAAIQTLRDNGHSVHFHDLYAEKFDPNLPASELTKGQPADPIIQQHCREIASANGIIIVHPNWWAQPPAILKGWVDRVLRMGVAYEFRANDKGEGVPVGLLKARSALVFNTSNTPHERELAVFGDPLENLWKTCTFDFCGVKDFCRRLYSVVVISTPEQRQAWLQDVQATVNRYYPRVGTR